MKKMRLDKFFTACGLLSRSECSSAARAGRITVDGRVIKKSDEHIDPENSVITLDGEIIQYKEFTYIMMNKPSGYVSTTDEPGQRAVVELLPEKEQRLGLFPCGRLDKDTVGLLILTNDGKSAHNSLSPKHHVEKTYEFRCADEVTEDDVRTLEGGVELSDGVQTLSCDIEMLDKYGGKITLKEGKYHQIKRMFASRGNKIIYLKRISFGDIVLDETLKEGQWRYLTKEEEESFIKNGNDKNTCGRT